MSWPYEELTNFIHPTFVTCWPVIHSVNWSLTHFFQRLSVWQLFSVIAITDVKWRPKLHGTKKLINNVDRGLCSACCSSAAITRDLFCTFVADIETVFPRRRCSFLPLLWSFWKVQIVMFLVFQHQSLFFSFDLIQRLRKINEFRDNYATLNELASLIF